MNESDAADAYRRWVLKKRRRAWRNVWKMIDATTSQLAARVLQGRRRRWRAPEPIPGNGSPEASCESARRKRQRAREE